MTKKLSRVSQKILCILLALMLLCDALIVSSSVSVGAYSAHTQQEAIAWVKSMVGQSLNVDGAAGVQCVDLIVAYYNYMGVHNPGGNASDYTHNALPSGWTRIQGATPQPGDILVYTGGENGWGHVGIFESTYSHYHQNADGIKSVQCITRYPYNGFITTAYWGVIRPDFSTHTHSYTGTVTSEATCTEAGVMTYTCGCGNNYTNAIPALGHSHTETVIPPTSTDKGYTLHSCIRCSDVYTDNYIDPPVLKDDGWYYCNSLPSGVNSSSYVVEYKNVYEKTQTTSPGENWTNLGVAETKWENSGAQYTSYTDLPTSDSRVLVSSVFYHWCKPGSSINSECNYEMWSNYVHYDGIGPNGVTAKYAGDDNGHPYYLLYWPDGSLVYCKSGITCDGSFGTHSERCKAWYKSNTYQDRVQVTYYNFASESDWGAEPDAEATTTMVRYKSRGFLLGDVTGDNDINIKDSTLVQKSVANLSTLSPQQKLAADTTLDGEVKINDATKIQKFIAKIITEF